MRPSLPSLGNRIFRWRSCVVFGATVGPAAVLIRTAHRFAQPAANDLWLVLCLGVALAGLLMRVLVSGYLSRGTSGRNTRRQKAARLNTTGVYSIVRNPLYLANGLTVAGIVMVFQSWPMAAAVTAGLAAAYLLVILAEERYLDSQFGAAYRAYASAVPRLIPQPWLWVRPELAWSWRMVLRREHDSAFSLVVGFVTAVHAWTLATTGRLDLHKGWLAMLGASFVAWLVVKYLKRRTPLLETRLAVRRPSRTAGTWAAAR